MIEAVRQTADAQNGYGQQLVDGQARARSSYSTQYLHDLRKLALQHAVATVEGPPKAVTEAARDYYAFLMDG